MPGFLLQKRRGRGSKASAAPERRHGPATADEEEKSSVTYQPLEKASPVVREEEFAKQLRLAR
jgi:hypothetical protein